MLQIPAVVLLGPRQVGKTTLARTLAKDWPGDAAYLERPADRLRLEDADTYVRDSGLLHGLLELETLNHLLGHPVCGLRHGAQAIGLQELAALLARE